MQTTSHGYPAQGDRRGKLGHDEQSLGESFKGSAESYGSYRYQNLVCHGVLGYARASCQDVHHFQIKTERRNFQLPKKLHQLSKATVVHSGELTAYGGYS